MIAALHADPNADHLYRVSHYEPYEQTLNMQVNIIPLPLWNKFYKAKMMQKF